MVQAAFIWCTFSDNDEAAACARVLLSERWISCANILPQMQSLFLWEGKMEQAQECGALFKSDADRMAGAMARLAQLHSYDTPVISSWLADQSLPDTLAWLSATGRS